MSIEMCAQCKELLDRAATAISLHLRAVSRLALAHQRHENDLIPALELAAYKSHGAFHGASRNASA
jgi:hypothetical protein